MVKSAVLSFLVLFLSVLKVTAQTGTLPILYIETENHQAIVSKTVYVAGTYFLVDPFDPSHNIGTKSSPLSLEIRGRGHSSWRGKKKPYKLRLGQKAPLLGMNKHRHWALLKFYAPTVAGMQLGKTMGFDWTPSTRPVEVVLNDTYLGLYLLVETNRISPQRLNIYEQPDENDDERTIPYGWLVEVDNYRENNQVRIKENSKWTINLTCHSPEVLSEAQNKWLIDEFSTINAAIYDDDKSGSTWEEYIDVDAMARYFIVQEVMDNSDGFHGSFYLHKDSVDDARWIAGPLWDLSCNEREKTDYTFRMKNSYVFTPHWIGELIKDQDFCDAVRDVWNEFYPEKIEGWMDDIDQRLSPCTTAFSKEIVLWAYEDQASLHERAERLKTALLGNIEWFNEHLPSTDEDVIPGLLEGQTQVMKVEYVSTSGMRSSQPSKGINIVETTYADGSKKITKTFIK